MVSSDGQVSGLGTGHPGDKVRKHRSPETAVTGSRLWERVLRQRGGTGGSSGTQSACREPAPPAAGALRWQRDLNGTAVRGRPRFPHPRPTSSAALATPPLVSKQSGLITQVPWCPFRSRMPDALPRVFPSLFLSVFLPQGAHHPFPSSPLVPPPHSMAPIQSTLISKAGFRGHLLGVLRKPTLWVRATRAHTHSRATSESCDTQALCQLLGPRCSF